MWDKIKAKVVSKVQSMDDGDNDMVNFINQTNAMVQPSKEMTEENEKLKHSNIELGKELSLAHTTIDINLKNIKMMNIIIDARDKEIAELKDRIEKLNTLSKESNDYDSDLGFKL